MKKYAMTVTFEDGFYYGRFVDFDAIADGETKEELLENAEEVLALELAELEDRGEICDPSLVDADNIVYVSASTKEVKCL